MPGLEVLQAIHTVWWFNHGIQSKLHNLARLILQTVMRNPKTELQLK